MNQQIADHFAKADPKLHTLWQLLKKHGLGEITIAARPTSELFIDLSESIVGQQLSVKAARTIWQRFSTLFPDQAVTPSAVMALDDTLMRQAGLSGAKTRYVKNLAEAVIKGDVRIEEFPQLSDREVLEQLTRVKGIGNWTAEMFLMFGLGRPDVFSVGDLGLRNAIAKWYQMENLTPNQLVELSQAWSPYRTYAARLLWQSLELPSLE